MKSNNDVSNTQIGVGLMFVVFGIFQLLLENMLLGLGFLVAGLANVGVAVFGWGRRTETSNQQSQPQEKKSVSFWNLREMVGPYPNEESIYGALRIIGTYFYVIAGIKFIAFNLLLASLLGGVSFDSYDLGIDALLSVFTDVLVYLSCGYFLPKRKSRALALFACVWTLIDVAEAIFTGRLVFGFLSLIIMIVPVFAVKATFAYHRMKRSAINYKHVFTVSIAAILYAFVFFMAVQFATAIRLRIMGFTESGNIGTVIESLIVTVAVFLSFILSFIGFLPFTRNKPFCGFPELTDNGNLS